MYSSTLVVLLASLAAVSALPALPAPSICQCDPSPSTGATLFKVQNPSTCGSIANDFTSIPVDAGCVNLAAFYGAWPGQARSLVVAKGVQCEFYPADDCPAARGQVCLGSDKEAVRRMTLGVWDRKIYSAKCTTL